jgi:hypothetical protein
MYNQSSIMMRAHFKLHSVSTGDALKSRVPVAHRLLLRR